MRRGAAHLGCQITALERLRMAVPGDTSNRQALLAATSDGGLLLLSPFWDESLYKRMAGLHVSCTVTLLAVCSTFCCPHHLFMTG